MDHLEALSFFDADTETSLEEIENRYKNKRTTFNTLLSRTTSDHFEKLYTNYINNIDAALEVLKLKQKKSLWGKLSLSKSGEVAEKIKIKTLKDFLKPDGSFDTSGLKNYGEEYFKLGRFKDAFPLFHKLNSLEPSNTAIKFRVTECRIIYAEMEKLRLEKEKEEKIRLEKERKAELERLKKEKEEKERLEKERQEKERLELERLAELERLEKERQAELERIEQEQREEEERRRKEEEARLEQERKEEEERLERERQEKERLELERLAELERLEKEKQAELERLEREQKEEEERIRKEEEARLEKERKEEEERLEKERLAREKEELDKLSELQKLEDSLLSGIEGVDMESDSLEDGIKMKSEEENEEEDPLLMELKRLEQEIGGAEDNEGNDKEISLDDTLKEIEQQEKEREEQDKKELDSLESELQNEFNGFESLESLTLQNDEEDKETLAKPEDLNHNDHNFFVDDKKNTKNGTVLNGKANKDSKENVGDEVVANESFFQSTKKRALFLILLILFISLQFFAFSKKSSFGLLAGLGNIFNSESKTSDFEDLKEEAEQLYKDGNFVEALTKFVMAAEKQPDNEYIKDRIDVCKVLLSRQNELPANDDFGGTSNNLETEFEDENWDELEELSITQENPTPQEQLASQVQNTKPQPTPQQEPKEYIPERPVEEEVIQEPAPGANLGNIGLAASAGVGLQVENPSESVMEEVQRKLAEEKELMDKIYIAVEERPRPQGGLKAFGNFVRDNLNYPQEAIERNISGRVILQFAVMRDGTVQNVQAMSNVGYGCEDEAIRVLKLYPKWVPGKLKGRVVNSQISIPIQFNIR
ncbi:energy transducer TonB [Flexithrix dorotheae]|uniref:energy transducer TonB n=1 Tax=Flexithrix dorotheae TaxID=70993 RepID=UPI00037D462F|nr:energy transducer TonB [Flexithrix dorotheae]